MATGEFSTARPTPTSLVREGDRNVFIGECKIFDPKNKQSVDHIVASALHQFLVYLVWRDTKAALLLFIRAAGISAIMGRTLGTMRQHPKYKSPRKTRNQQPHAFAPPPHPDTHRH